MSKRGNDGEINKNSKQPKPNDAEPSEIDAVVDVDVGNQEPPPSIFKLNAICCDDLFEWLSIKDLHSLGQTCKRMHQLTGIYFQENFLKMTLCTKQNIYHDGIQLNEFISFVRRIELLRNCLQDFQYIAEKCDSLQTISIFDIGLTENMIDCIKVKLDKIEMINLYASQQSLDIHVHCLKEILSFCSNLKNLHVGVNNQLINDCLYYKYPKLENMGIKSSPNNLNMCEGLELFFIQHSHLQSFETNQHFLLINGETFIKSKLKLDLLSVEFSNSTYSHDVDTHNLLNKLYDNGFYKRLKVCIDSTIATIQSARLYQITKLRGLEKLFCAFSDSAVFSTIVSVKELCISSSSLMNVDLEAMTTAYPNVSILHIYRASLEQMLLFLRRLPKLQDLSIKYFIDTNGGIIDLTELHEERQKLLGACKVNIYIRENVYLSSKMTAKNLYIKHDLIEIRRIESSNFINIHDCYLFTHN